MKSQSLAVEMQYENPDEKSAAYSLSLDEPSIELLSRFPIFQGYEGSTLEDQTRDEDLLLMVLMVLPCVEEAQIVDGNLVLVTKAQNCNWSQVQAALESTISSMILLSSS